MTDLPDKEVHDFLELISQRGCEEVNKLLNDHALGIPIPEIKHLPDRQQHQIVVELHKVMAVYTACDKSS